MPAIDYIESVLCQSADSMKTLTEIFAEIQTAQNLTYWQIAKQVAEKRGGDANRYGSAVKKAIANMDDAKFPMIRDCFEACGVDIVTAIAIAAAAKSEG
ncbi:MAG: hypothetical protein WBA57_21365 [Elainellaceae cyanobacterium]